RAEVEQMLELVTSEQAELEAALAADAPKLTAAQDTWYQLSALAERLRGTVRLAAERKRHLSAEVDTGGTGRDPEELLAEAERAAEREAELNEAVVEARSTLAEVVERREHLEQVLQAAERAHLAAVRAIADRREGIAKLSGQVEALRSKSSATAEEIDRLTSSIEEAVARAEAAMEELETARVEGGVEDSDDEGLRERHQRAVEAEKAAKARVDELVKAERAAERDIASEKARVDALSMGLARKDGAGALLAAADDVPGLLGSVAALLTVDPGYEAALAAAPGPVAAAVAGPGRDGAVAALRYLRGNDAGRAERLIGDPPASSAPATWPALPEGPGGRVRSSPHPTHCGPPWSGRWSGWQWCPRSTTPAHSCPLIRRSPRSPVTATSSVPTGPPVVRLGTRASSRCRPPSTRRRIGSPRPSGCWSVRRPNWRGPAPNTGTGGPNWNRPRRPSTRPRCARRGPPSGCPAWRRPLARRSRRSNGCARHGRRSNAPATTSSCSWRSWRNDWRSSPNSRWTPTSTPASGTRLPRCWRRCGRRRWTPASLYVPPRNVLAASPVKPIRCAVRPRPSARPGSVPRRPGSRGSVGRPSRPPWSRAARSRSTASRSRCSGPPSNGTPSRRVVNTPSRR